LNGSNALQTRYLRGDQVDQLFASVSGSGTVSWQLTDRLGSVRNVVNNSGVLQDTITYDGYGCIKTETNAASGGRYKFTGREQDTETGLQFSRNRYYDPKIGRWIEQDPLGFSAGDGNLYRYVGNGPTNATDPTGLDVTLVKELAKGIAISLANFGGGQVKIKDGPEGAVTVRKGVEIERTRWPDQLKDPSSPPLAKDVARDMVAITYTGTHADELGFVQFTWMRVVYVIRTKTGAVEEFPVTGYFRSTAGRNRFTTNPKSPYWDVDVYPNAATPYYPILTRGYDFVTIYDAPTIGVAVLDAIRTTEGRRKCNEYMRLGTLKDISGEFHADTYLVYNGLPVYKVSWVSRFSFARDPFGKETGNVDVTDAGPAGEFSDAQQREFDRRKFPKRPFIP
jgi:RHS repeat-associated protein